MCPATGAASAEQKRRPKALTSITPARPQRHHQGSPSCTPGVFSRAPSPKPSSTDWAFASFLRTEPLDFQAPGQGGGRGGPYLPGVRVPWPEGQAIVRMPLPEPSDQEDESVQAGQGPSPDVGTDVLPAAPGKPEDFSNLVLLMTSDQVGDGVDKPTEVHCIVSLEMSGPATLASTLQTLPAGEEQALVVQPSLRAPEQRRSRLDTGEGSCPLPHGDRGGPVPVLGRASWPLVTTPSRGEV